MTKRFLKLLVLLFCFQSGNSQISEEDYPIITDADIPGAKFSGKRKFIGTSLFGYIDGGAELYLEYGFSGAVVCEISAGGSRFKTDIYKMTGPEEAFGIFSVSKYRCLNMPDIGAYSCLTRYQLQFCKGPYYVSIINSTGTQNDSLTMLRIGRIISDKITGQATDITGYLPAGMPESVLNSGFLAKGRLGILNGSPDLEDFFKGTTGYTAVIMKVDGRTLISVKFSTPGFFREFLKLHQLDESNVSTDEFRTATGESVKLLTENHLLIELLE